MSERDRVVWTAVEDRTADLPRLSRAELRESVEGLCEQLAEQAADARWLADALGEDASG
jgi:hypothetical protein